MIPENVKHILSNNKAKVTAHYRLILSAALLTLLILTVYGHDLQLLFNEALYSESLSHVLLMPFFTGLLFYLKRDMVKASLSLDNPKKGGMQYLDEIVGISLCLIAFLIYWYGSHTFYPLQFHLFSIPIFLMGVTLILSNLKTLSILLFPLLFLFFIIPPPTEHMYLLGGSMANFNTQASYHLLQLLGLPATLTSSYGPPTIALTSSTGDLISFAIDVPCSGIYSLLAFAMLATFLSLVVTASIPKKIGMFIIGFITFEFLSIIRITTIVSIGYWFGEEIAMLVFHTVAGLILTFLGMIITLLAAEKILKIRVLPQSPAKTSCPECENSLKNHRGFCTNCGNFLSHLQLKVSRKFLAKLLLLIVGCYLVTFTIHAPTFAVAEESIEVTSGWQNTVNIFPTNITDNQGVDYTLIFLYRDTKYEEIAHQDASLMYAYFPPPNQSGSTVYVDVGIADTISNLHSWEVCLISIQTAHGRHPLVSVMDSRDKQLLTDVPIVARYLVFQDKEGRYLPPNYTQVTLYWYERANFKTGITVQQKYVRISLIILTDSSEYQQLEEELFTFGRQIARHWQPLKTQSIISIGVPTQQLLLALSIGFVTFTKTAEYINEERKRGNNLKIFNRYASTREKLVFQTIQELTKDKKKMKIREINKAIKEKTGKPMDQENLLNILNQMEKYGFIKKDIVSVGNQPKLIWKRETTRSYKP